MNGRQGGHHSLAERFWRRNVRLLPAGIRTPDRPACDLVTVLATVFRFTISWLYGWLLLDNEKGIVSKTNEQFLLHENVKLVSE